MLRRLLVLTALLVLPALAQAQDFIRYSSQTSSVSLKDISATAVQVTGAAEEVVRTYTIPAGLLANSGDALRLKLSITSAANANAKTIRLRAGGVAGTQLFLLAGGNNNVWDIEITIFRTTASNAQLVVTRYNGSAAGSSIPGAAAAAADLSVASDLVLTFACPTANTDLTSNSWTVELLQL